MACHFSEPVKCVTEKENKFKHSADEMGGQCYQEKQDDFGTPFCRPPLGEPTKINPDMVVALCKSDGAYKYTMESHSNAIQTVTAIADDDKKRNAELLELRAREVDKWRSEIKTAIILLREETDLLEGEKRRLLRALKVLQIPEAIVSDSVARRSYRTSHDLVHDAVDTALNEADRLNRDIRDLFSAILNESNSQLETNKTCLKQLEFDWSDKTDNYCIETFNIGLRNNGPVSFYPGATRLPANQSTPDHWLHYTKEQVCQGQSLLKRSAALRKRIEEEIAKATADIRKQSDRVDLSLQRNIAAAHKDIQEAETDLMRTMNQITEVETVQTKLARMARQIDFNLKTAQTRLHNRNLRPRAENTRDCAQYSLINEVHNLNQSAARIQREIEEADATLRALFHSRGLLEDKIAVKRKTVYIDRERCQTYWAKIPDSAALAGYNKF